MDLYPYQRAGAVWLLQADCPGRLLGDDMGLGKTAQAIAAFNASGGGSMIVVCPASLKLNWAMELRRWLSCDWLPIHVLSGGDPWPWPVGQQKPGVVVLNYDILHRFAVPLAGAVFDFVVGDEAHYLKGRESRRSLIFRTIRAKRRILMTGTPMLSSPADLWPLLYWLDREHWGTWPMFSDHFCPPFRKVFGTRSIVQYGAKNLSELNRRLSRYMLRRMKRDVLTQLPSMTRALVPICGKPGTPMAEVRKVLHAGATQEGPLASIRRREGLARMPAVAEYCLELVDGGEPCVVVFAYHRDVIEGLRAALPGSVVLHGGMTADAKHAAVQTFQAGEARFFLGQIESAGVGLTLTRSSRVVFAEYAWTPAAMRQAADRVCRIGQTRPCQEDWLYVPGSLDEAVMRVLDRKAKVSGVVVDGLVRADELEEELKRMEKEVF